MTLRVASAAVTSVGGRFLSTPSSVAQRGITAKQVILFVLLMLGLAFIIVGQPGLPNKYFYDAQKIGLIALGGQIASDPAFDIVAGIYRVAGLATLPTMAGVLGFLCFCAVLGVAAGPRRLENARPLDIGIMSAALVFAAVYLGQFSKDLFVLPIAAIALTRKSSWRVEVGFVGAMALYASLFRTYWLVVLALYIAIRWISRDTFSLARLGLVCASALGVLAIAFALLLGFDVDHYRELVNTVAGRSEGVDAVTLLTRLIPLDGYIGAYVNSLLTLLTFWIAVPLLANLSALYLVSCAFLFVLWTSFLFAVKRLGVQMTPQLSRAVSLILAFAVVQSIFEPDYGSYIRHFTPLTPVLLFVILEVRRPGRRSNVPETSEQEMRMSP